MEIELRPIVKDNWHKIATLKLAESQKDYVFDNSYSIAESFFCERSITRGIYLQEEPVGFLMYEFLGEDAEPEEVEILRFMIDEKFQCKGLGRKVMPLLLKEIQSHASVRKIHICTTEENTVAQRLYESFHFVDNGIDEHGQTCLVYSV